MKVNCPNILSSMYAQEKLVAEGICDWLWKKPLESQTFTVVFPPCGCCIEKKLGKNYTGDYCQACYVYKSNNGCPIHDKNDKPLILKDNGMAKIEEYTDMFDALSFLKLTHSMKK